MGIHRTLSRPGNPQPLGTVAACLVVSAYDSAFACYIDDALDKSTVVTTVLALALRTQWGFPGGASEQAEAVTCIEQE